MKTATVQISDDVMDVLKRSTIGSATLKLPEQLDRKLYLTVNKVLELAGGKWNKSAKCHVFPGDPKRILGMAMEEGAIRDDKKTFQAFYTPDDLAQRMVQLANITPGMQVLEPSAGEGAIAKAIERAGGDVYCVEIRKESADKLMAMGFHTRCEDFLKHATTPKFGAICMNSPFSGNQDIKHVEHALKMLAPGGTLVAIMSGGVATGGTKLHDHFRSLLRGFGGKLERLPGGTFKESGTGVETILLTVKRPA